MNKNINRLKNSCYPGRGIIIGLSPDANSYVQIYWIMGRSVLSRNRIFIREEENIKISLFSDDDIKEDTSLIVYYPMKKYRNQHIVSNGNHTEIILNYLIDNKTFEDAIETLHYEPDEPNFTPRIAGVLSLDEKIIFKLAIIKRINEENKNITSREIFSYEDGFKGQGYCIHTYIDNNNPLPSFQGEPYIVPIFNDINETSNFYWDLLNSENKISLVVKYINIKDNVCSFKIFNKNK